MSVDPHRALIRALPVMIPGLVIDDARTEPWASNTYTGERHIFACRAPVAARAALGAIGEAEFGIPGHLVADIVAIRGSADAVTIEVLTIEDC